MRRIGPESRGRSGAATHRAARSDCACHRRFRFLIISLAIVESFAQAQVVAGQAIRGRVVHAGGVPAKGALVRALDADGGERALSVSDALGRFSLPDVEGVATLHVDVVGYRAARVAPPAAGLEAEIELAERVDVRRAAANAGERCEAGELSEGVALLWSEVRKAIAIEAWARAQGTFGYDVFQYERQIREGDRIDSEQARALRDLRTHPARSRPPAELGAEGYARRTPRGDLLYAPDGDVLLSREFAASHCFRVHGAADRNRRVGLAFEPSASDRVDIRGVMWLDAATAELQSVEFTYTGLTDDATRQPRGALEFRRLPDGLWIMSRWWVRTPLPRESGPGHREEGVEVMRVAYADGTGVPVVARANLLGSVRDTLSRPVEGVRVRLLGTAYEAVTNADGRFLIPDLPAGRFRLAIAGPEAPDVVNSARDVWLYGNQSTDVELRMASETEDAGPPAFTELDSVRWVLQTMGLRTTHRVDSLLKETLLLSGDDPGRVIGRVFDRGTGRAIAGAEITLTGAGRAVAGLTQTALTGADGRFSLGDLPAGAYVIQTRMLGYEARQDSVTVPAGLVIDAEVALATQPIQLDPISVSVHSRWLDANGFFERRDRGGLAGHFFTRRDIERKKPALFTDLLRDIPGVAMQTDEVGKTAVRFRRNTTIMGLDAAEEGLRGCTPAVFYDGIPLNTGFDRLHNIPIPFIDGVEVYVGAATPIEYKHPCGVILIWTRRPR